MIDRIQRSSFLKFSSIVFTGNLFSQLMMFTAFIGFARYFDKVEIGIYFVFISLSILFSVLATGRYEMAIMLPKHNKESKGLLKVALILALIFSMLFFIILFLFPLEKIITRLGELQNLILLLPVGVFFMASFQSFIIYFNKQSSFRFNAVMKFTQALLFVIACIFFSKYFGYYAIVLVISWISSQALVFILFSTKFLFNNTKHSLAELKNLMRLYNRYPRVSLAANIINTFSIELPNYIIPAFWGASTLTLYGYGAKVAGMPRNFIGSAIGDVFFNTSSKLAKENPVELLVHLRKVTRTLLLFSTGIYIVGILSASFLFPMVFGESYQEAVPYFQWIALASIFLFVQSPISVISDVVNQLKAPLTFNIISIFVKVAVLGFAAYYIDSAVHMIAMFSIASGLLSLSWIIYLQKMTKEFVDDKSDAISLEDNIV